MCMPEYSLIYLNVICMAVYSSLHMQLDTDDGEVQLVRVRNPWGNECEWKGAWSDQLV